ncbi:hypothetical protein HWV62_38789 [Athelia sp. TMB]|nr:hypothetical protein HWV62_38789 [Athelia sp. TMB]
MYGFLAGSEVKEKGALNAGLLDQNLALQWVQQHSHAENLEAIPQKSPSGAKAARGGRNNPQLFQNAITSSTVLTSQYPADGFIPQQLYNDVVNMTGCLTASDSFACLVAADARTLADIGEIIDINLFYTTLAFVPVIDGHFIVERPTLTLERGIVNGKSLLSVTNAFEGRFFTPAAVANITEYIQSLFPFMTDAQIKQLLSEENPPLYAQHTIFFAPSPEDHGRVNLLFHLVSYLAIIPE